MLQSSTADTLSSAYSDRWEGATTGAESDFFLIEFLASNELIFVVLSVSLIIWFVLAFYLVRVDKKIDALENKFSSENDVKAVNK
jgi:hypothetical protein